MDLQLINLRRYAIDTGSDIKFSDPNTGHRVLLDRKGVARIEEEDRNFVVENVLRAALEFRVEAEGKRLILTRSEMARAINDRFQQRGFASIAKDHDD